MPREVVSFILVCICALLTVCSLDGKAVEWRHEALPARRLPSR